MLTPSSKDSAMEQTQANPPSPVPEVLLTIRRCDWERSSPAGHPGARHTRPKPASSRVNAP